ncbi:MAG: phenylalanine--tRNA ligase subunit beta [Chthoniobacterales bacterium]
MKFSVNWLRELVELSASVNELADLLTFAGVEIEGIEHRGLNLEHVVIGQINASTEHPNADRLSVCEVDDGTNHKRRIVCGAKNYKVGDKVPVALPGATLPNGLKIKVSKLRGVESQGMLCSPIELGVSEESDGLLILPPDVQIGAPIGSLYPPDTILDVEITPNRSDLLSYVGLAREIAALRGAGFQLAKSGEDQVGNLIYDDARVRISALRECPFYSALRIDNITVGPSPEWLRAKLEAAGLRAISNIVDITNFVMLELGQPLHAFDADKLEGGINVRRAGEGEKFLALDGKTYSLTPDNLMIADSLRAVAIGGVMGGEDTSVTDTTRNVLLESAYFLPASIRRTARTLNLPSDASYRFERGVDPAMTLPASARAAQLIAELVGGKPATETAVAGEPPTAPADVSLRYQRCDQLLGVSVPRDEIDASLTRLGLTRADKSAEASTWKIPSYRADLKREVDLIEEIVRVYGINKIPSANRSTYMPVSAADRRADFETALRQRLIALGIFEVRTSALIARDAIAAAGGAVELKNPLSEDHVALRPTLLRGLLDVLARNHNMGASSVRLFELGRIFLPPEAQEKRVLALLFSGDAKTTAHWRANGKRALDFFDLKGAIEMLHIPDLKFRRAEKAGYALAAEVLTSDKVIGSAGRLAGAATFLAEIELDDLANVSGKKFQGIDKFPAVARDIAMIVPEKLSHVEIETAIRLAKEPLLADVRLFDLFGGKESESIGAGRKSLAYTLTYRDQNRTLTNDEVAVVHSRIRERLQSELGAELRE